MSKKIEKEQAEQIASDVKKTLGEGTTVSIYSGRKFPKNTPDFVMLFQAVNITLAKELHPSSCKVLLYMISLMKYSNHVGCDQLTIAEELGLSIRSVNGAILELKKRNIIIDYKDSQDRRRKIYIINPHQSWKGTFKERFKKLKEVNSNQTKLLLFPTIEATTKNDMIKEVDDFYNANTNANINTKNLDDN